MITVKRAEYLSALTCAGVKDVRYYLNGIFFDAEGFIVGTDGHRLFCGKATTEGESAIINVKAKPPAKFDHVVVDIENRSATFIDDKAQEVLTSPIDIIDGRYPDWRRVSHFKPGKVEAIGLHLPYLADAAKCSKYFDKKANCVLEMQDSAGATRFRMGNDAYMLIMPVRMR
ncbi:hypothetical protein M8C85_001980 [Salmonella enterica]|uniref:Uncharacterized protein n=1 Tax=Salmonella enterica TaxID=28901 RepID=A0A759NR11_SALER|nr:hypothetical protein [Salmonella enterica subsp. enterica serovar Abony]EDW1128545.1 hypothetical protein [Salmonella enterica subsp. enterica]EGL1304164.1 hypothetical protein [Salmonella enterica]EGL1416251.1 hypothetical protein [Salmonella enterica]EGL1418957.1 hypothetical protein [Salmonella enterica]